MVVFDILIYVFFAYMMYVYAKKSYAYSLRVGNIDKADGNLWMFWLFFALICGIRWNVGVDCIGYMKIFDEGRIEENSVEHLWDMLVWGIHRMNLHYTIGMAVTSFVQIYFATKWLSRYRFILIFFPIVLFGGEHFLSWCNAVRQMMAACIFVYSTQFIINRRLIPYILCIFVASQIHHSAQILYIMYVFAYIKPNIISISDKKVLTISVFIICFILGFTPQFQNFLGIFDFLVENLETYDYVNNVIQETVIEGDISAKSFGPMQLSYFLTALASMWFGPELKREFKDKIPNFDLWWFFSFIYACAYFLVCNVHNMFIRPILYFQPFQLLIVSLLLYFFYTKKLKIHFWGLVGIIWVSVGWNIVKSIEKPIESVTYKLFLFHNDDLEKLLQHSIQ